MEIEYAVTINQGGETVATCYTFGKHFEERGSSADPKAVIQSMFWDVRFFLRNSCGVEGVSFVVAQ